MRRAPRLLAVFVLAAPLSGCESIVEHLAEKSDPGHAGANADCLRSYPRGFDVNGEPLPSRAHRAPGAP
jgi:hypothetical protein